MHTLVSKLRPLIGRTVTYQGVDCRIVEVLEEGPQIVLGCTEGEPGIQPDQYGNATRRAPRTLSIPVLSGSEYSPAFLALRLPAPGEPDVSG